MVARYLSSLNPVYTPGARVSCPVSKYLIHTALEVLYRGSSCGHEVHVTYETMGPGELSKEFGRYTKTYPPTELSGIKTTAYEDIENVFSDMWTNYNFVYKNCKRWTNDLIKRLR
uniref:PPPDE domain-containing protein n=1 Tax=Globodera rostochiensis TaxID=31243 RepID=A0A914H962_GLORO